MDADTYSPKALFKKDIRYEIPTFQRPYVWNQEDQWEPLWDDVRNVAERYLENLGYHGGDRTAAQMTTPHHFLGAVVLQQQPNAIADLETWQVIDGQQRMTTLQIMLDATQEVFAAAGAESESKRLLTLVENQLVDAQDDKWKLWPTALDREAFVAAMTNDMDTVGHEGSPIVQAHAFFRLQVEEWLKSGPEQEEEERAHALETALMGLLTVVAIDLAPGDDSFVIFETLNARGTPLNQSDLVKNFLLQRATGQGIDAEQLHKQTWQALETPHWREEVVQGRIRRPRLDQFLNYWLSMRTTGDVTANDVFPAFKRLVDSGQLKVDEAATDVRRTAERQTAFEGRPEYSRIGTFNYRMRIMQSGSVTPLLLWLTSRLDLEDPSLADSVAVIEDFLVRRMIRRSTTKDYNKLFLEAVARLDKERGSEVSVVVLLRTFLAEQNSESRSWPGDLEVEQALLEMPLYRLLTRGRLRFVLEALEEERRKGKSEDLHVPRGTLTIEHLMPQAWSAHWQPPVGDDPEEALARRNRLVHAVGNLTLLTQKLNSDVSNGDWPTKTAALMKHATMKTTLDLLEEWGSKQWDENAILDRGKTLAALFKRVWPGPTGYSTST